MKDAKYIINKYSDIITEELNIKEVGILENITVKKIYKPIGSQISAKFGKDTGSIIQNGKQGNVEAISNGSLRIFDSNGNERILDKTDYEVSYEWLDGDDTIAETGIIVKIDRTITPELEREGIARELSRFLNQMRKDADLALDEKIVVQYETKDDIFQDIIKLFGAFLQEEAQIKTLEAGKNSTGRHTNTYSEDERTITFTII